MSQERVENKCKYEKGEVIFTYLMTPNTGYGVYSKVLPIQNEINDHCMSNINIEQVDLKLMNYAESGSTHHPLQMKR